MESRIRVQKRGAATLSLFSGNRHGQRSLAIVDPRGRIPIRVSLLVLATALFVAVVVQGPAWMSETR